MAGRDMFVQIEEQDMEAFAIELSQIAHPNWVRNPAFEERLLRDSGMIYLCFLHTRSNGMACFIWNEQRQALSLANIVPTPGGSDIDTQTYNGFADELENLSGRAIANMRRDT